MRYHWMALALSTLLYAQMRAQKRQQEEAREQGATCAVAALPAVCECHAGIILRCRSADLLRLPLLSDKLKAIELLDSHDAEVLPAVYKSRELRTLRVNNAKLNALPLDLCSSAPQLRSLDLMTNQLRRVPDLHMCVELRFLELSWNKISIVDGTSLRGLKKLKGLLLIGNLLNLLTSDAFLPTPALHYLNLESNLIANLDPETFVPISKLCYLNLARNRLSALPTAGLQHLRSLAVHNNPDLRNFHPPHFFPNIKVISVAYSYHCCEYMSLPVKDNGTASDDDLVLASDIWDHLNTSDFTESQLQMTNEKQLTLAAQVVRDIEWPDHHHRPSDHVRCIPSPGPFQPCVDLFNGWVLRGGAWFTFLLLLFGNGIVLVVLVLVRRRMDVPRFLVINLATADLCMGTYLGLLVVQDWRTLGQFRENANAWKNSTMCRFGGFLAVFSSELSMFSLTLITLERYLTITNTFNISKQLSLRQAIYAIAVGWALSLTVAALPLHGISDYSKSAICLPFKTDTPGSMVYVVGLVVVNGIAFLVLFGSYFKIYRTIRDMPTFRNNEKRIATNMALLVFLNFLGWAPIAFFVLTAAAGIPLISPKHANLLTVFVLPLNSCFNPFLYVILTNQFKEECKLFCRAIQKLGIKRCIHCFDCECNQEPAECLSLDERRPVPYARQAAQREDSPVLSILVVENKQESIENMYNETSF